MNNIQLIENVLMQSEHYTKKVVTEICVL